MIGLGLPICLKKPSIPCNSMKSIRLNIENLKTIEGIYTTPQESCKKQQGINQI